MTLYTDVVIIGTGVAGLYTALNLKDNINILMLCKGKVDECNTALAQGGISTARNKEDIEDFIEDTMKAGQYKNDVKAVEVLAKHSIENIEKVFQMGMDFERDKNEFCYTREGAHKINRIVYYKDKTGARLEEILLKNVRNKKNVTIYENTCMIDILKNNNVCGGVVAFKNGKQINIHSKVTVFATGGIGGIFKNSTNQRIMTGNGIAIALKNNIKIKNLDYIQFHPTAFYQNNTQDKRFLISESVRGEGGKLLNAKGTRFVDELLPRDVVTKYIYKEEAKTNCDHVYLDVTFMDNKFLVNRFPTIYDKCRESGIDISKEYIPVSPAQHYFMGGIDVDLYSRTSMENLFACGEVSCTGVHGANRLASNSLLEGLVFSKRGAEIINNTIDNIPLLDMKPFKVNRNLEFYEEENKEIIIDEISKVRGDIKHELVNS